MKSFSQCILQTHRILLVQLKNLENINKVNLNAKLLNITLKDMYAFVCFFKAFYSRWTENIF